MRRIESMQTTPMVPVPYTVRQVLRETLDLYRDVLRQKLLIEGGKPVAGARSIEPFQVSGWCGGREAMGFQCSGLMRTRKNGGCELGDLEDSGVKTGWMR
jgi:hypothetical protein